MKDLHRAIGEGAMEGRSSTCSGGQVPEMALVAEDESSLAVPLMPGVREARQA